MAALEAADAAESWIGAEVCRYALSENFVDGVPELADQIIGDRRRYRQLPNAVPVLFGVFRDRPELGAWLRSPAEVERLARYVGAARSGGVLRNFVERDSVKRIVDRLGDPVWKFALVKGKDVLVLARDVDDVIDGVEADGRRAVAAYLRHVLDDLYPAAVCGLGEDWFDAATAAVDDDDLQRTSAIIAEVPQ